MTVVRTGNSLGGAHMADKIIIDDPGGSATEGAARLGPDVAGSKTA